MAVSGVGAAFRFDPGAGCGLSADAAFGVSTGPVASEEAAWDWDWLGTGWSPAGLDVAQPARKIRTAIAAAENNFIAFN